MSSPSWNDQKADNDENEKQKEKYAKENHSEIERRRRSKMNDFIEQLANLIPSCNHPTNRPDKLSILKFAATHCEKMTGARNHELDEPALVSLSKFSHIINEATNGCLFMIEPHGELRIQKTGNTIFTCMGLKEAQVRNQSFLTLIHPEDHSLVRDMLSTSSTYMRRMLDSKTFQVREESFNSTITTNERREFIVRLRTQLARSYYHRGDYIPNPAVESGYMVMSVCAQLVEAWHQSDQQHDQQQQQHSWALFVRHPDVFEKKLPSKTRAEECTVKIQLDGTLLFCDAQFATILNKSAGDIRKLLGQKIWEVLVAPDVQDELRDVIQQGHSHRQEVKIRIRSEKRIVLELRPVINPHSKQPEFIIGHLREDCS